MRILVTGGAGFIGSAVIRLAIQHGHSVINVDSLTYAGNLANLSCVTNSPNYKFEQVDIRNKSDLDEIFKIHQPNAVMHLAAESHVDRSIDAPSNFIETNVYGTFNMLEASRRYWVRQGSRVDFRFHHISTDEVFGSLSDDPTDMFHENTPYNPQSPYSASKASSDHLVRAWHGTFGLPTIITNCSNNYGPYQFPEKLIPVMIINALKENILPIYGNGTNVRDWLYVEDHADALLLAVSKGKVGRTYNIGGENELTNIELVKLLCKILDRLKPRTNGSYEQLISFVKDRPGHDARYAIDPSRIKNELGWKPSLTIEEGLEKTVRWYLNNKKWWEPLMLINNVEHRLGIKL